MFLSALCLRFSYCLQYLVRRTPFASIENLYGEVDSQPERVFYFPEPSCPSRLEVMTLFLSHHLAQLGLFLNEIINVRSAGDSLLPSNQEQHPNSMSGFHQSDIEFGSNSRPLSRKVPCWLAGPPWYLLLLSQRDFGEVMQGTRRFRAGGGKGNVRLRMWMTRNARRRYSCAPLPQPLSDPSSVSPSSSNKHPRSHTFYSRKLASRYGTYRGAYASPPDPFTFRAAYGQVEFALTTFTVT